VERGGPLSDPKLEIMPGVIMENGERHGSHTNHDRDRLPNGINGGAHMDDKPQDKGKGKAEPQQNVCRNADENMSYWEILTLLGDAYQSHDTKWIKWTFWVYPKPCASSRE
jgi:hypothetical protein